MGVPEVPVLCPGGTVLCIGGGPSLTREDVEYCRGKVDAAIAINNAYQIAPWADVLWGCDAKWWKWHEGVPNFAGVKYSLEADSARWPGVQVLENTGEKGLELKPTGVRHGRNGGYQAINCAVHLGAKRILLLGYDMQHAPDGRTHWHGGHPSRHRSRVFAEMIDNFSTLVQPLKTLGVDVVNCSLESALACFPKVPLREALA